MKSHLLLSIPLFLIACNSAVKSDEISVQKEIVPEETEIIIDISLSKMAQEDLPYDMDFDGDFVDAHSWEDVNGRNYFIRTISDIEYAEESGETAEEEWLSYGSQHIYAYHFIREKGKSKVVRKVEDYIERCEFDINVSHEMNSLKVSDIDNDSIGEVSFVYRLTCTSDVSPSTQKLILLENGDKYILRGETEVMGLGGTFKVDESFDNAPAGFLEHCEALWSEHLKEYDFEL